MSEKRFIYGIVRGSRQVQILDCHTCKSATIDVYNDDFKYFVDLLNEQQSIIDKLDQENADLLGARIKAQEEWEKCTDKLKEKIVEQQATIEKQNELIKLIANACTYSKEHSVKEILRNEIKGIDTVTCESAGAWHDYVLLSGFFEEFYGEHWDNE